MKRSFVVVCLFAFCSHCLLLGQKLEQQPKKIGLALSGGAAHGFAHIGVIQYLTELDIPIAYVTGTSMGSVIGAFYALGYSPDEIVEVAKSLDWDMLISNNIPLNEVAPVEKAYHDRIPFSALWQGNSFSLPQSFIRGQKLDLVIAKVYAAAHHIESFDDMYRPFRCVAVDIEDGSIDIFKDGYIGDAVRASMSIPSVFRPKELNGTLYVDGGLRRNFPVEEVISLGADYVIGVYVGSEKKKKKELISMLDIMRQSASLGNILDSEEQADLADLIILPDVKDYGTFDFQDFNKFIELGYKAAKKHSVELLKLKERLEPVQENVERPKVGKVETLRFDDINIESENSTLRKIIRNKLEVKEGYAVTLSSLEDNLSLIFGTKNFSNVNYTFKSKGDKLTLDIYADEADPFSLGININRFELYNTAFILSGEARNFFGRPSSLRLDFRVSDFPGFQGYYFLRFPSAPGFLVRLYGKAETSTMPFYTNQIVDRRYEYEQSWVGFEFIQEWRNKYLFSIGYQFNHDKLKPDAVISDDILRYQSDRSQLKAQLSFNDLNRQVYPDYGMQVKLSSHYFFNNLIKRVDRISNEGFLRLDEPKAYAQFNLSMDKYWPLTFKWNLSSSLSARWSSESNFLDHYKVGGPSQGKNQVFGFAGLADAELLIGDHLMLKCSLRHRYKKNIYLSLQLQQLYGEDYLSQVYLSDPNIWVTGAAISVGYNSIIGPVNLEFGFSSLRDATTANLGIGYRHIF